MPKQDPTRDFTMGDWRALRAAGIVKDRLVAGKVTITELDIPKLDELLAETITSRAKADEISEVTSNGLSADDLLYDYIGFPNVVRERPILKGGDPDWEWLNPTDVMLKVIKGRLRLSHTGAVQKAVLRDHLIMFTATKEVYTIDDAGHRSTNIVSIFAVSDAVPVIERYVAKAEVERAIKAARRSTLHWGALTDAVPAAAGVLVAALDAQVAALEARRVAVFEHVLAALTPAQRAELEAELPDLIGGYGAVDLRDALALPAGAAA